MYLPDKNSYNYIFMDGEKMSANIILCIVIGTVSHEIEENWHTVKKNGYSFSIYASALQK